jgi:hypothetical protein
MDPSRTRPFSARCNRDRLRISFRDRGIVACRVDPPLSDMLLAGIAGAILWALIQRAIRPSRQSLEQRVEKLAELVAELRAARNSTSAADGMVDCDGADGCVGPTRQGIASEALTEKPELDDHLLNR